jgi:hypothetical protein
MTWQVECAAFLEARMRSYVEGDTSKEDYCDEADAYAVSLARSLLAEPSHPETTSSSPPAHWSRVRARAVDSTPVGLLILRSVGEALTQAADIYRAAPHKSVGRRVDAWARAMVRGGRVVGAGADLAAAAK